MRRRTDRVGEHWRAAVAGLFARVGLWLALAALGSQALAFVAPPMSAASYASDLRAALGADVIVCTQVDDKSPAPSGCDDKCPLCQAAHGGFAFVAPDLAAFDAPAYGRAAPLGAPDGARRATAHPPTPQARGPPTA